MFVASISWFTQAHATPVSIQSKKCPDVCFGYLENDFTIVPPDLVKAMAEQAEMDGGMNSLFVTVGKLDGIVQISVGGTVLSERNLVDAKSMTYWVPAPAGSIERGLELSVLNLSRNSPFWEVTIDGSAKKVDF